MSDLRYLIECRGPNSRVRKVGYHYCEPEKNSGTIGGWRGGFDKDITRAVVYDSAVTVHIERTRFAKIYPDYTMKVKSMTAKELFKAKLIG